MSLLWGSVYPETVGLLLLKAGKQTLRDASRFTIMDLSCFLRLRASIQKYDSRGLQFCLATNLSFSSLSTFPVSQMIISQSFLSFQNSDTFSTSSSPSPSLPLSFPPPHSPLSLNRRPCLLFLFASILREKGLCKLPYILTNLCACPGTLPSPVTTGELLTMLSGKPSPALTHPTPSHYSTTSRPGLSSLFPTVFVLSFRSFPFGFPPSK